MIPRYFLEELLVTSIRTDGVSFSSDQIQNIADSFRGKPLYTAYATENTPQSFDPSAAALTHHLFPRLNYNLEPNESWRFVELWNC